MDLKNGPFRYSLDPEQSSSTGAEGLGEVGFENMTPLRNQRPGIQQGIEKHFIPLKQGGEETELHELLHWFAKYGHTQVFCST